MKPRTQNGTVAYDMDGDRYLAYRDGEWIAVTPPFEPDVWHDFIIWNPLVDGAT